ncbi:MAG TPA: ribonuclease [Paraburkholderia sp.]|jgi:ribonuclease T1|nr:ribonuclease [Paraburkholderia sp.]
MARNWLRIKGVLIGAAALWALSSSAPEALARDFSAPATAEVQVGTVALAQLPGEAVNTLNLIAAGGPYPYQKDGVVFGNFERVLPAHRRGYYHEYTVPTPHARNRGARRIVCGGPLQRTDNCYYSDDHYTSFNRIVE